MNINLLILVNFRGGEKFFDVFNKGIIMSSSDLSIEVSAKIPTISVSPHNLKETIKFIEKNWKLGTMVIGNDCVTTYGGLLGVKKHRGDKPFGLVVCDQHLDIYSYEYCGEILNKATVIRKSIDDNLISYVVFVGTRPSEEAAYEETGYSLSLHDREYAKNLRDNKVLAGLEEKMTIIPSYKFNTFSEGVIKAFTILKNKGIDRVGLMIDLDSFDSSLIKGVTYNVDYSQRIKDFMAKRISEEGKLPNLKDSERINDYLLFMESEIAQKGIPSTNMGLEIKEVLRFLNESKLNLMYIGITEYEPNHKDIKTKELVEQIVQSFSGSS